MLGLFIRGIIPSVNADAPVVTDAGTLSGAVIGTETTATAPTATGTGNTITYQWLANNTVIPGETSESFTPTAAQDGKFLQRLVTATNVDGSHSRLTPGIIVRYPAPSANGTIPDQSFDEDTGTQSLDVTGYFTGGGMTYSVINGGGIATAGAPGEIDFDTSENVDTVSITVRGSNTGGFVDQTFSVTIVVAAPQAISTLPNRSYTQNTGVQTIPTAQAFSGDFITYSLTAGGGVASINASTGVVSLPTTTVRATTTITVQAENSGGTATRSFTITVVVAAPVLSGSIPNQTLTVGSGTVTVDGTQAFTGQSLTYSITPVGIATVNSSTGLISIDTAALATGAFTLRATNASGFRETSFSVTVNDVAPVVTSYPSVFEYDQNTGEQVIDLTAFVVGENLVYNLVSGGSVATVTPAGSARIQTGSLLDEFPVLIDVSNTGGTRRITLHITVEPLAPVITSAVPDLVRTKGVPATYDLTQHVSGVGLEFARIGAASFVSVSPGGLLTINTTNAQAAQEQTIQAYNVSGSVDLIFDVTVRIAAPAVVGPIPDVQYDEQTGVQTIATAPYFSGEELTYTLIEGGPVASINASTGVVSITTDTITDFQVTVQASNSTGSVTQSFLVDIVWPASEIRPPSGQYVAMMAGAQPGEVFVCASPPTFLGDAAQGSDNGGTGWNIAITVSDDFYSYKNTPAIPGASAADTLQTTHDAGNLDIDIDEVRGLPIGEGAIGETFIVGPIPVAMESSELDGDTCTRIFLDEDLWGETVTLTAKVVNQAGVEAVSQDFTLNIADEPESVIPANALTSRISGEVLTSRVVLGEILTSRT